MSDRPIELQLPPLVNCVKVTSAVALGDKTQKTMIIARKPKTWTTNMTFWKTGMALEPQMFSTQTRMVTAMTMSVPCQFVGE
jgi:hypothetical protein